MEDSEPSLARQDSEAIIVKADEVDESGADISTISPSDAAESESEFNARIESRRAQDAQPRSWPMLFLVPPKLSLVRSFDEKVQLPRRRNSPLLLPHQKRKRKRVMLQIR